MSPTNVAFGVTLSQRGGRQVGGWLMKRRQGGEKRNIDDDDMERPHIVNKKIFECESQSISGTSIPTHFSTLSGSSHATTTRNFFRLHFRTSL